VISLEDIRKLKKYSILGGTHADMLCDKVLEMNEALELAAHRLIMASAEVTPKLSIILKKQAELCLKARVE
jgi:hypothetical protein